MPDLPTKEQIDRMVDAAQPPDNMMIAIPGTTGNSKVWVWPAHLKRTLYLAVGLSETGEPPPPPRMPTRLGWAIVDRDSGDLCVTGEAPPGTNWPGPFAIYTNEPEITPEMADKRRTARVEIRETRE